MRSQLLTEFPELCAVLEKSFVAKSLIFLMNKLAPLVNRRGDVAIFVALHDAARSMS